MGFDGVSGSVPNYGVGHVGNPAAGQPEAGGPEGSGVPTRSYNARQISRASLPEAGVFGAALAHGKGTPDQLHSFLSALGPLGRP